MSTIAKTRQRMRVKTKIKEDIFPFKRRRIPVSKVYWKKGMYEELVDDPYNLKE